MDFKKLYEVFVEEAAEHLDNLENGLLELEKSPDDPELLNSIFRAAHTIKGSSGSLGLKDISVFTHLMEEILDAVRNSELSPEKELISVLLEGVDLIKEMVSAVAEEQVFEFDRCCGVMERMKKILNGQAVQQQGGMDRSPDTPPSGDCTGGEQRVYKIRFVPSPDLFKRGIDPAMIIQDLNSIGEVFEIKACGDLVPRLSEMDIESVYLRWDLKLRTTADADAVRKVFLFVEDGSEIEITLFKDDIPMIGQMLVEDGLVSAADVESALREQKRLGEILVEKGKADEKDIKGVLEKQNTKKADSFKSAISSSIRVDLKKLDHLVNLVGEMVIIHSMFQQVLQGGHGTPTNGDSASGDKLDLVFSQLQRIGKDIQESAMSLRMLPVGEVFQRFTRLVRELSSNKGKDVELVISGEDTELDKGVLEKIADPLVHLIRNSVDHGIETPDERVAACKPAQATVYLRAYQSGDAVYIEVEDDGRGLNKDKITAKAIEKGIISDVSGMTEEQIFNLIFLPGFSTAEKVTDVSGRGVGMDVVRRNIEALNGVVAIRSRMGAGTLISIRLPLTLAIIDGLSVLVGGETYIIPITSVVESLRPAHTEVKTVEGRGEVVDVRGEYIPLIRLHEHIGLSDCLKDPCKAIVVVAQHGKSKFGLMVDSLIGEQQVVLKNLGKATPKVRDIAGGTITGDGKVALVLDVAGLVEMAT